MKLVEVTVSGGLLAFVSAWLVPSFCANELVCQRVIVRRSSPLDGNEDGEIRPRHRSDVGFIHEKEMIKVITARKHAKVRSETKLQTDAVTKAHAQPFAMLLSEWS